MKSPSRHFQPLIGDPENESGVYLQCATGRLNFVAVEMQYHAQNRSCSCNIFIATFIDEGNVLYWPRKVFSRQLKAYLLLCYGYHYCVVTVIIRCSIPSRPEKSYRIFARTNMDLMADEIWSLIFSEAVSFDSVHCRKIRTRLSYFLVLILVTVTYSNHFYSSVKHYFKCRPTGYF